MITPERRSTLDAHKKISKPGKGVVLKLCLVDHLATVLHSAPRCRHAIRVGRYFIDVTIRIFEACEEIALVFLTLDAKDVVSVFCLIPIRPAGMIESKPIHPRNVLGFQEDN